MDMAVTRIPLLGYSATSTIILPLELRDHVLDTVRWLPTVRLKPLPASQTQDLLTTPRGSSDQSSDWLQRIKKCNHCGPWIPKDVVLSPQARSTLSARHCTFPTMCLIPCRLPSSSVHSGGKVLHDPSKPKSLQNGQPLSSGTRSLGSSRPTSPEPYRARPTVGSDVEAAVSDVDVVSSDVEDVTVDVDIGGGGDDDDCIVIPSSPSPSCPRNLPPSRRSSTGSMARPAPWTSASCPPSRRSSIEWEYRPRKVIGKLLRQSSPVLMEDLAEEASDELPDLECTCALTTGGSQIQCPVCRLQGPASPAPVKRRHGGAVDVTPAKVARLDRHFMDTLLHGLARSPSQSSLESIDMYGENGLFSQVASRRAPPSRSQSPAESYDSLPFVTLYPDELPDLETEVPSRACSISSLESIRPYKDGQFVYQQPERSPLVDIKEGAPRGARVTNCVTRNASHSYHADWEAADQDYRTVQRHTPFRWLVLRTPEASERMGFVRGGDTVDVRPFPEVPLGICEAAQEEVEYSRGYVPQLASMVLDYANSRYEPPAEMVYSLLQLLLTSHNHAQSSCLVRVLHQLASQFPPYGALPFSWDDVCNMMDSLALPYGITNQSAEHLYSLSHALNYMVSQLEAELMQRSLRSQRQVSRSLAYEWLSADSQFSRVRQVLQWLGSALTFGEYESHGSSYLQLDNLAPAPPSPRQPGKDASHKVLPLLQRLLQLTVTTARNPEETCSRIGTELGQTYLRAPGPRQRHLLLSSTVSPLLRYKAADHLLQTHCMRVDNSPASGSVCLRDIVDAYFQCDPPCSSFTPPPTPSDGEGDDSPPGQRHSEESVEELAMLLWTVVEGYLAFTKDKLYLSVTRRTELSPDDGPGIRGDDLHTLRDFSRHVASLRNWLKSLCGSLTPKTNIYLCQLETLATLAE